MLHCAPYISFNLSHVFMYKADGGLRAGPNVLYSL